MTTYREKKRHLKSVGSADDPMAPDWFESAPQELSVVHFARNPANVRVGDLLVYYAAAHQLLLGIVEVFMPPEFNAQLKRWPYFCQVRPRLMVKDFERAPSLDVLIAPGGRDFRKIVMRRDYVELGDAEYERALTAIDAAVNETLGDIRDRHFNRAR